MQEPEELTPTGHHTRRRKKRPSHGVRTIQLNRGSKGFGFTISGQQPCILSCIVPGSPADLAGLRSGDCLVSVNGYGVGKSPHDDVVRLIGKSGGALRLQIAENFYSDSSDDDRLLAGAGSANTSAVRLRARSRPRHNRPRSGPGHMQPSCRVAKVVRDLQTGAMFGAISASVSCSSLPLSPPAASNRNSNGEDVLTPGNYMRWPTISPPPPPLPPHPPPACRKRLHKGCEKIVHRAVLEYMGSIDIPRHLQSASRMSLIKKCIKRVRSERRNPNMVLLTIHVSHIKLSNAENRVIADFPASKIVYSNSFSSEDKLHFGILTKSQPSSTSQPPINSCHVFRVQNDMIDHALHADSAQAVFGFTCTRVDEHSGCQEFPVDCRGVVGAIRALHVGDAPEQMFEAVRSSAPSPQPSNFSSSTALSSNSDSGIGFRDDCGIYSDNRIDNGEHTRRRGKNVGVSSLERNFKISTASKLTVRALPNSRWSDIPSPLKKPASLDALNETSFSILGEYVELLEDKSGADSSAEGGQNSSGGGGGSASVVSCPCVVPRSSTSSSRCSPTTLAALARSPRRYTSTLSVGTLGNQSYHHRNNVATYGGSSSRRRGVGSCDSNGDAKSQEHADRNSVYRLDDARQRSLPRPQIVAGNGNCEFAFKVPDRLSPKVYTNFTYNARARGCSMENLEKREDQETRAAQTTEMLAALEKTPTRPWGSMQEIRKNDLLHGSTESCDRDTPCGKAGGGGSGSGRGGVGSWSLSFEKLLIDPKGLQTFAKYLRKEVSHENIYFWAACERYADTEDQNDRKHLAAQIYERHLSNNAIEPVNVDSRALAQITPELLDTAPTNLFAQAQKQVFNLMKFDCYPRFLRSDIYRKCLESGETPDDGTTEDGELILKNSPSLKHVKEEGRCRKSILPWHRKNRSKSKDRGELEYNKKTPNRTEAVYKSFSTMKRENANETCPAEDDGVSISSSRSSLASWDLALRQSFTKHSPSSCDQGQSSEKRDGVSNPVSKCTGLCRVILPDGSTTVVPTTQSESVRDVVTRLLDKRALRYSNYDVLVLATDEIVNLRGSSTVLASQEVEIIPSKVIKLDLPSKRVINVVGHSNKTLKEVLKPHLTKHGFKLDLVTIWADGKPISVDIPASAAPLKLSLTSNDKELSDDCHLFKVPEDIPRNQSTLDEITNKVFEELRVGKSTTYTSGSSCKSDDQSSQKSEGSSILSGKFFSKDSVSHIKKKSKSKHSASSEKGNEDNQKPHPPLIAKWRNGVKLQLPSRSRGDDLLEGLKRAQRGRLDDQRGTEINTELPDFLKNKENDKLTEKQNNRKSFPSSENYEVNKFYESEDDNFSIPDQNLTVVENCNGKMTDTTLVSNESPKFLKPPPLPPKPRNLTNSLRNNIATLPPRPFQRITAVDKKPVA